MISICEREHGTKIAMELGNSFGLRHKLRVQGCLMNAALLWNLVSLSLGRRPHLGGWTHWASSWGNISEMFGDFHINFGRGGNDKFLLCSIRRSGIEKQRSNHKQQTALAASENHLSASGVTSGDEENSPTVTRSLSFLLLAKGCFAVV